MGLGAVAVVGVVPIMLLCEYISMIVDVRNTFEGCLSLVSASVCNSVAVGLLEMFAPCERTGSHCFGSLYYVASYFDMCACSEFGSGRGCFWCVCLFVGLNA